MTLEVWLGIIDCLNLPGLKASSEEEGREHAVALRYPENTMFPASIEARRMMHQAESSKYQCMTPTPAALWVEDSAANPTKLPWSEMCVSTRMDTKRPGGGYRYHRHHRKAASNSRRRQGGLDSVVSSYNDVGDCWRKCELLGRGAHGVVYRGVLAATGESVAVKQISTNRIRSELRVVSDVWIRYQQRVMKITLDPLASHRIRVGEEM